VFPCPHRVLFPVLLLWSAASVPLPGTAGDAVAVTSPAPPYLPSAVTRDDFQVLTSRSPFLRPLDPSKTLALTGIAEIAGEPVATLFDRESKTTHLVTRSANARGWQIVAIEGDRSQPETVAARISVAGEVFSVRFDPGQLKPESSPLGPAPQLSPELRQQVAADAKDFRDGISGDGFRGPPPPEVVAKLSRLSQGQRERIIGVIAEMRQRGVSSEERQQTFLRMIDRSLTQPQ